MMKLKMKMNHQLMKKLQHRKAQVVAAANLAQQHPHTHTHTHTHKNSVPLDVGLLPLNIPKLKI